jgi:glycosyltransferase involved in cell wall biosynthesis
MKINITCIISCYNEAKNIPLLLKTIYEAELQEKINFIIINNGSNDNSRNLLKVWSSKYKKIKFIDNRKDNGWGYGIKTGLISNKNSIVGWTHGDMEYSVYDLKKVLKIISSDEQYFTKTNNWIIKGQRINRKFSKRIFSLFHCWICSLILKKRLYEINAQPVFFNTRQIKKWKNIPNGLELDMYGYYNVLKNTGKEIRINVEQKDRLHGTSSWNKNFFSKISLSWKLFKSAFKIKND